jgi:hypothetical protein
MKGMITLTIGLACIAAIDAPAWAEITDVNAVVIEERIFNDYPDSTLVTTNDFPTSIVFDESEFGEGGFANMHAAWLSSDGGTTRRPLVRTEPFDISVDVTLETANGQPRKEAGFRVFTAAFGEGQFIVTSDGEVAAFGGPLPFHSFGGDVYTIGETVTLRMIYQPSTEMGVASTVMYMLNGESSGVVEFDNPQNGIPDDANLGFYLQNQVDKENAEDFGIGTFGDVMIDIPEPATLSLLATGLIALGRRRRA